MTYQEFIPTIQEHIVSYLPKKANCDLKLVTKNNGCILNGLVISEPGTNIYPTIYLEPYYEDYRNGDAVDTICKRIISRYETHRIDHEIDMHCFTDYKNIKDRIVFRLVNRARNETLLADIPFIPYLDLAIVFYVLLTQNDEMSASILLHNNHLKSWGVKAEDLMDAAKDNTPKLLASDFQSIRTFLMDVLPASPGTGDDCPSDNGENLDSDKKNESICCDPNLFDLSPMYVLTNTTRSNGASALLYPYILEEIENKIGGDFYVLPSSIHEVMVLPADENTHKKDLDTLVDHVNRTQLVTEDILSDHAYYYDAKEGQLRA